MAGTGAVDGVLFWGVHEGCISGNHTEVKRRPYHRNCGCALHKSRAGRCPHQFHNNVVSYPITRSRSEGCLASTVLAASSAGSSPSSSTAAPPAAASDAVIQLFIDFFKE
ncbi:hypothetical protein Nepgr_032511 [Nepenthes gracilis]|uniref:Uncharacterized protein n=1 Tax=Nepenthes gracilis TaxID=150966 RepID=A0AAD3TKK7_NEPGR|nr:hypothetical protein Nepgr_032511 [Nepenthes gracilis]